MEPKLCVSGRREWRAWLKKHHATIETVWLVYFKKHTDKPTINYIDSVEEALCFGWIDGIKKRIDEQKYTHRFTPRKRGSKWSPLNIELAAKMMEEGKMTQAGLVAFDQRIAYDEEFLNSRDAKGIPLTSEIERSLKANQKAWENFNNLAPSYRKQYVGWLTNAKRQETREKRMREAIRLLAENKKLGMK